MPFPLTKLEAVREITGFFDAQQTQPALSKLRELLPTDTVDPEWKGEWAFRALWSLRRRAGPRLLVDAGLHEALISTLWASVTERTMQLSDGFSHEWVGPELRDFAVGTDESLWPPRPWQLGAAAPIVSQESRVPIRDFLLGHLERVATLDEPAGALRNLLLAGTQGLLARAQLSREQLRARPLPTTVDLLYGLTETVPLADACHSFARWLAYHAPTEATRVLTELDALLMIEEARKRLPSEFAAREPELRRAVFRASPLRALEVVVVELRTPGQFGTLARHQVPVGNGKTAAMMTWVEGSCDEALAAVPSAHFGQAVRLVRGNASPREP